MTFLISSLLLRICVCFESVEELECQRDVDAGTQTTIFRILHRDDESSEQVFGSGLRLSQICAMDMNPANFETVSGSGHTNRIRNPG